MKKAALIILLVPMLFLANTITVAAAEASTVTRVAGPGGHGGGGSHGGGFHGGGFHGGGGAFRGGGGHHGGFHGGAPGGHWGHGGWGHGGHRGHGHGGGHWSGNIWIGGPWFWDPFYYPFYPYYAYPYPSTTVVVPKQEPETYIQAPQPESYWYYCKESRGYYPYVKNCPSGWMRVVPNPAPPAQEPVEEEYQ